MPWFSVKQEVAFPCAALAKIVLEVLMVLGWKWALVLSPNGPSHLPITRVGLKGKKGLGRSFDSVLRHLLCLAALGNGTLGRGRSVLVMSVPGKAWYMPTSPCSGWCACCSPASVPDMDLNSENITAKAPSSRHAFSSAANQAERCSQGTAHLRLLRPSQLGGRKPRAGPRTQPCHGTQQQKADLQSPLPGIIPRLCLNAAFNAHLKK